MLNQTQAQSYAIQPGNFHDWQYEKLSAFADARDEALESFKQDTTQELISDVSCGIYKNVDGAMCDIQDAIGSDGDKSERLNRILFKVLAGSEIAVMELRKLLETEFDAWIEHQFETATDRR